MLDKNSDKHVERDRYDNRASEILESESESEVTNLFGADSAPLYLRFPYVDYEKKITSLIFQSNLVLELGAGSGLHTGVILSTGASVIATDISPNALLLLKKNHSHYNENLETNVADMESIPYPDNYFDAVCSAGSLSYGDTQLVLEEIYRVLKPDGYFIAVDSLNHNLMYKFNRWLHYKRGDRSLSTLNRMPNLHSIDLYRKRFGQIENSFYGSVSWFAPIATRFMSEELFAKFSDWFDTKFRIKKSAFKFLMVAKKVNNHE